MPGKNSEWNVETLRQFMLDKFTASNTAIDVRAEAMEKRFDSVNEFRGQLADQASTFVTKVEYYTAHKSLEDKVITLNERRDTEIARVLQLQNDLERRVNTRLDTAAGILAGNRERQSDARLNVNMLVPVIATLLSLAAIIVSVFLK
jgi:membrane-bound ClpP family serine protease